jgi:hypothetical protein
MMAVAAEMPASFGGFWYDSEISNEVVVGLTDPANLEVAIPLVEAWLDEDRPTTYRAEPVEYPFALLAAYRTMLRPSIFEIQGVVGIGVKESQNRVQVLVESEDTRPLVLDLMGQLEIPPAAVLMPVVPGPQFLADRVDNSGVDNRALRSALTLQGDEPDGEIQSGWQTRVAGVGSCSLGITALDPSNNYSEVFVTNSHCTTTVPGPDGSTVYQATLAGTAVGVEIDDPTSTCGSGCRQADAALVRADVPMKFETVARTTTRSNCDQCNAGLVVDTANPSIPVTGEKSHNIENEELHKVGRSTGWTYGNVEDTCNDYNVAGFTQECSDRVDFSAQGGDSGAAFFRWTSSGNAEIRGVVFGWQGWPFNDALVSDLHQIELDLGDIVAFEPDVNATISGPSAVPQSAVCNWVGSAKGRPPFTYEWRRNGAVVATTKNYNTTDTGTSAFSLSFKVTDGRSLSSTASLGVTPDPGIPGIMCSW